MRIATPLQDRTAITQIGDLMPIESYTLTYRNFNDIQRNPRTGSPMPVSLADTYVFRGSDVGLEDKCNVLVQSNDPRDYRPDGFGYRPGEAYMILSEKREKREIRRRGLNDRVPCIVYEVERLPDETQSKIFKAMKRDLETVKHRHFGSDLGYTR